MIDKVREFCKKYHMLERGGRIVVGISGGADSVCLFYMLLELKEEWDLEVIGVHVNHGIRGEEALLDQRYVEDLCKGYCIKLRVFMGDIPQMAQERGISLEEAGRDYRYACMEQVCAEEGAGRIAVAHHQGDQAETVLFHLVRGSGIGGLKGMEPVRGRVIRPLLCVGKEEILKELSERGVLHCEDGSNQEVIYTRNKLRLEVMPKLREVNAKAEEHICRLADTAAELNAYVEQQVHEEYAKLVKRENLEIGWQIAAMKKQMPFMQKQLIYHGIADLAGQQRDLGAVHVEAVLDLMELGTGHQRNLPYGLLAVNEYGEIRIGRGKRSEEGENFEYQIAIPGEYTINETDAIVNFRIIPYDNSVEIPKKTYTKAFDYDKIKIGLKLRTRMPKDRIVINEEGGSKAVKKYLMDEKVPQKLRGSIPLLADGNDILWIIGYRISAAYKVSNTTRRIIIVEYKPRKKEKVHGR